MIDVIIFSYSDTMSKRVIEDRPISSHAIDSNLETLNTRGKSRVTQMKIQIMEAVQNRDVDEGIVESRSTLFESAADIVSHLSKCVVQRI